MDIKERVEVWKQSRELGRCICSLEHNPFPCPCPYFLKYKSCKCNNEELVEGHTQKDWAEFNTNECNKNGRD